MTQLHETLYGKRFFESQLPDLTEALNKIGDALGKSQDTELREAVTEVLEVIDGGRSVNIQWVQKRLSDALNCG